MNMSSYELTLSEVQGKLFVYSGAKGYESATFIDSFMNSTVAKRLDTSFNYLQWAGAEIILAEFIDEADPPGGSNIQAEEALFWIGFIYRYWHFYTNESSADISAIMPAEKIAQHYIPLHSLDPAEAVDRMREMGG